MKTLIPQSEDFLYWAPEFIMQYPRPPDIDDEPMPDDADSKSPPPRAQVTGARRHD